MAGSVAALLLADGRFPNGSHAHSGGMEEAVNQGLVVDVASLRAFLVGRARTAGLLAAALAGAACWVSGGERTLDHRGQEMASSLQGSGGACASDPPRHVESLALEGLRALQVEADVRMCSPAQRRTSARLGHQLLRAARTAWPSRLLEDLAGLKTAPHHGVVLGVVASAAGLSPVEAASCAAYEAAAGPAGAAVRLLGLDPLAVTALLAELAPHFDRVALRAVAGLPAGDPNTGSTRAETAWMARLPAPAAPLLDHLAEAHTEREVRLFAS